MAALSGLRMCVAAGLVCAAIAGSGGSGPLAVAEEIRVGTFAVDASPAVGSPLAYDPTKSVTESLSCRGIVITGDGEPIVIVGIDWLGVANDAHQRFRRAIAAVVGTSPERVVVHALHQHDAPRCDLSAAELLGKRAPEHYDVPWIEAVIAQTAAAASAAKWSAKPVERLSVGAAEVVDVASNRRMLGPDGNVFVTRFTACKDPEVRALPVGVIDPMLRLLAFEGTEGPIAVLTFYATHPQSYYRTGEANPDFPGMARNQRQAETGVFHLHLNGAGGNIGAGKYNDGATENRAALAERMADGMRRAWEGRSAVNLEGLAVNWATVEARLPVGEHLQADELMRKLESPDTPYAERCNSAEMLAFLNRADDQRRVSIPVSRLRLGEEQVLFLPGELFVEYQLAAAAMAPAGQVMVAAYGDYGTAYIGTRVSYDQGGYEVSQRATNVSADVEQPLVEAMRTLLDATDRSVVPSDFTERR
jgi:hypothetical protein